MTHLEMTQEALRELGDAPPQQLADFICQKFGAKVEPKAVLILKASVVAESLREAFLRKIGAEGGQEAVNSTPESPARGTLPKEI